MMNIGRKMASAGAALLAVAGLVTATAPTAHAEGSYNIMISTRITQFWADYCLLTTTSGNGRAACSGNKWKFNDFRLGTVHNTGDRVWLDINIVGGKDRKGIDLRGMHYIEVKGDLAFVEVCGYRSLDAVAKGEKPLNLHGPGCAG
ncbi:hypothetical protein ACFWMJ_05505 [Streptomyces hawaiiensis]|uniref:hypothetical protein n=1 Tax=Streptomyces hawaiiensis TaxID=67305 RepID=UPI0036558F59